MTRKASGDGGVRRARSSPPERKEVSARPPAEAGLMMTRPMSRPMRPETGWELMLHFCRLGLGLAVVNSCCRLPQGLVSRPLPELPGIPYFLLRRRGSPLSAAAEKLAAVIRETVV